jgi:hypothetical protein
MEDPCWQGLPEAVFRAHVLPRLDIDARLAFGDAPRKLEVAAGFRARMEAFLSLKRQVMERSSTISKSVVPLRRFDGKPLDTPISSENADDEYEEALVILHHWKPPRRIAEDWDARGGREGSYLISVMRKRVAERCGGDGSRLPWYSWVAEVFVPPLSAAPIRSDRPPRE